MSGIPGINKGRTMSPETRAKISAKLKGIPKSQEFRDRVSKTLRETLPRGANHHAWKGGRGIYQKGYVVLCVEHRPGERGSNFEHRIVAEKMLGRPLKAGEIPHHINENRADNREENLMILLNADHQKVHDAWRKSSPAGI